MEVENNGGNSSSLTLLPVNRLNVASSNYNDDPNTIFEIYCLKLCYDSVVHIKYFHELCKLADTQT